MTRDTTLIFSHGSREGAFPYMSASTYFPFQHQCWLKSQSSSSLWPHALSQAWNQPILSPTKQTDSWLTLLKTCYWLGPSFTQPAPAQIAFYFCPWARLRRICPEGSSPILKSWGFRAWSCLPLAWSSSFSWQFSSSLASWNPCPHLKVRAQLRPLKANRYLQFGATFFYSMLVLVK